MHEWALAEAVISTALKAAEKERVRKITEIAVSLGELQHLAQDLLDSIQRDPALSEARREILAGETTAMQTTLRILAGEPLTLTEEVQGLYGVQAEWTEESVFDELLRDLDEALPGSGRLGERVRAFDTATEISAEVARAVIEGLAQQLRQSTRRLIELPEGEACEVSIVRDKPWRAYNWYLGQSKSRIEFSEDVPIRFPMLPRLVAHEAYAGHHTEHAIKEAQLYRQAGQLEYCLVLANAPSAVVSEGIATAAFDVVTPPQERLEMLRQAGDRHGLRLPDPATMEVVTQAYGRMKAVLSNATLLRYDGGATDSEILSYQQRFTLCSDEEAARGLAFLRDPLWRSYSFTYTTGEELVRGLLAASPSPQEAFAGLLREPVHPAQLRRGTQHHSPSQGISGPAGR